ncbi:MAG: DUF2203 domain-containing protein [Chloroflexi bacterium]|nr:DUF2203 domain-containing protein [Chloroflexota bacterium]
MQFERYFTPEEANTLLPQLRPLLVAIQAHKAEIDHLEGEVRRVQRLVRGIGGGLSEEVVHQRLARLREAADALQRILDDVQALGCQVKDLDTGLVDFPSRRGGEIILLCWRVDEPAVAHWHDLESGFRGRQPL